MLGIHELMNMTLFEVWPDEPMTVGEAIAGVAGFAGLCAAGAAIIKIVVLLAI